MLPEALSNGLCSLKPAVDRLAMVCEMEISKAGALGKYQFYESVIHSHARLTYTQVGAVLENGITLMWMQVVSLICGVCMTCTRLLRGARDVRGAIDFETVETRIIFDDQRKSTLLCRWCATMLTS